MVSMKATLSMGARLAFSVCGASVIWASCSSSTRTIMQDLRRKRVSTGTGQYQCTIFSQTRHGSEAACASYFPMVRPPEKNALPPLPSVTPNIVNPERLAPQTLKRVPTLLPPNYWINHSNCILISTFTEYRLGILRKMPAPAT